MLEDCKQCLGSQEQCWDPGPISGPKYRTCRAQCKMNTCGPCFKSSEFQDGDSGVRRVRVWAFQAQSPKQWHRSEAHDVGSAGICHGPRREGAGDLTVSPSKDFMVVRQKSQHPGKTSLKGGLQASPLDAFSRFPPSEAVGRLKPCSVFWV